MALSLILRTCSRSKLSCKLTHPAISYSNSSGEKPNEIRKSHEKSVYKREEAKRIRFYILNRFIEYLKNYDKVLEKNFPTTMKTYKVFTEGTWSFIADTRHYFKIVAMLNSSKGSYTKLLRREIELQHQMPKDITKVAPVLLFSTLPFAFYILLPLIYALPKQLLTSHFWTEEQKVKFETEYLHDRLVHNKPVFRHLQSQLKFIKHHRKNRDLYEKWNKTLGLLGSGDQPTIECILACKELFKDEPYHLLYLSRNHVFHLLRVHGIHAGWFRRTRLADRALGLIEMDRAIMREGGVHNLPLEALRKACYLRGFHTKDVSHKCQIQWLTDWIKISSNTDKDSLSLLLHAPIFLGYNEPSNWRLLHPERV
ncbi:unnamed protein product [Ceutorhynchus assimilis]|uniref:Letm1 RBD domain-containing protein n=1 Tax=Ceutorhynchus assimilis TaxID=467358 RepID=A0A9N9QKQ4_9CUCU|nr:unnamed protein product [Ceutorhynchus assimilis]